MRRAIYGRSLDEFRRLAALETDECVLWPYSKAGQRGYGLFYIGNAKHYTHREALRARQAMPADRTYALHGPCNQPSCMNYRHLHWGTASENSLDKRRDGTDPTGERNPMAKLTNADVRGIRSAYSTGLMTQRELAGQFGVSVMTINRAVRGETWAAA